MSIFMKTRVLFLSAVMALAIGLSGGAIAAQKGSLHVAFGDIPGADMINFIIAVNRAKARGVKTKITYLTSEDIASQAVVSGQADIGVGIRGEPGNSRFQDHL